MQSTVQLGSGITCLDANYVDPGIACFYLIEGQGEAGSEYALVETGTSHSVPGLLGYLQEQGIGLGQVRFVIPTHVHLDHAGGVGAMMAAFPDATLLIHPRGARHMAEPQRLVDSAKQVYGEAAFDALYGEITPVPVERIREIADGEKVDLGNRTLEFRHARGHANHHMCVWDEQSRGWFTGDMFGVSYGWFRFDSGDYLLPSTTPTQFDPDAYFESLDLLASYNPHTMYLTHFGEMSYGQEKSDLLREQVHKYCELAKQSGGNPEVLQEELSAYTVSMLVQLAPDVAEETLRKWAAFDVPLNTQGLLHWLR